MDKPGWLKEAEDTLIRYCGEFSPILVEKAQGLFIYTKDRNSCHALDNH